MHNSFVVWMIFNARPQRVKADKQSLSTNRILYCSEILNVCSCAKSITVNNSSQKCFENILKNKNGHL